MRPSHLDPYSHNSNYNDGSDVSFRPDISTQPEKSRMETRDKNEDKSYQTTKAGDVIVVEPSFDADENDGRGNQKKMIQSDRVLPAEAGGHRRNLSEHFQNATSLDKTVVGQKHRRVFSGELSNPPEAHRRMDSGGASSRIPRSSSLKDRQHQRVDSAGLDILTAAVENASRDELAAAAGGRSDRPEWERPRRAVDMISYDHSAVPPEAARDRRHNFHPSAAAAASSGYHVSQRYAQPHYAPPHYYRQTRIPPYGGPPPALHSGYPVQYARPLEGPGKEAPAHALKPPENPPREYPSQMARDAKGGPILPNARGVAPAPGSVPHWRGAATQGSQTYVTTLSVGEAGRTMHPTAAPRPPPGNAQDANPATDYYHHRKTSSIFSWVPSMSVVTSLTGDNAEHPLKAHHRSTSSSLSFLGLDVGALDKNDAAFLKNLQASSAVDAPAYSGPSPDPSNSEKQDVKSKLAAGGTSKRVRRKCIMEGCQNRVVQGGLCIAHGAKRKQCKHPGCTKNVKKAGLCSTHGPARKRCEADGCNKVAVQGGRCIAHGAKKKLCKIDGCAKQAILAGMCKKHHDQSQKETSRKPTHTRGLSLFQEISAEAVGDLLGGAEPRHRSTFSTDFSQLY